MHRMKTKPVKYRLFWAPEGKPIATVQAIDKRQAIRLAPMPYRRYLGEIYAELVQNDPVIPETR